MPRNTLHTLNANCPRARANFWREGVMTHEALHRQWDPSDSNSPSVDSQDHFHIGGQDCTCCTTGKPILTKMSDDGTPASKSVE
eukprot:5707180-Amphidinium_carterae.1